jgi:hypothetical protein
MKLSKEYKLTITGIINTTDITDYRKLRRRTRKTGEKI